MSQNHADNVDTQFLFYGHKYESFIMSVDAATNYLANKITEKVRQGKELDHKHYSDTLKDYDKSCVKSGKSYINNIEDHENHTKPDLKQIDRDELSKLRKQVQILDDLIIGKWLDYS